MAISRLAVLSTFAAAALAMTTAPAAMAANGDQATASFIDAAGRKIGKATLTETANGVLIHVKLRGLRAGAHGFHIHETGKCEPKTGFKSAGGHLAAGHKHGYRTEGGPHPGDMPNQFVGEDGVLEADVVNTRVSLAGGSAALLDADGAALVVHAKADDYGSQPAGDAGDRVACAVIRR